MVDQWLASLLRMPVGFDASPAGCLTADDAKWRTSLTSKVDLTGTEGLIYMKSHDTAFWWISDGIYYFFFFFFLYPYRQVDTFSLDHSVHTRKREHLQCVTSGSMLGEILMISGGWFQGLPEFWPEKGSPVEVDAGNFKLSMREDLEEQSGYTTRDFILESIQVKLSKAQKSSTGQKYFRWHILLHISLYIITSLSTNQ